MRPMSEESFFLPSIADEDDKTSPLKNRIRKNYRHIRKWAKRTVTNCFRIYDRDIKECPLAIDFYDGRFCIYFFSYDIGRYEPLPDLKEATENALISIFEVTPEKLYWKTRVKRAKIEQYEKLDEQKEFFTVSEYGVKFKVNLNDYLDTGLFLDHRETRQKVASLSKGKKLLNLFAYTCSFSVHAAVHGASYTQSIDLSNTYTDWGADNFRLNSLSPKTNEIFRADCVKILNDLIHSNSEFDLILIDPPTISRSKKMDGLFDIQVDYVDLITKALKILSKDGVIFFSTNSRKFKFDESLLPPCSIRDISEKTIPLDFRNKKIHSCWTISHYLFTVCLLAMPAI
jgi:23S rRNA G2069 N7-methylase RlmK/C1962 C5-methylase RlmI